LTCVETGSLLFEEQKSRLCLLFPALFQDLALIHKIAVLFCAL